MGSSLKLTGETSFAPVLTKICVIYLYARFLEKRLHLISEVNCAMVDFLVLYIFDDGVTFPATIRNATITVRPSAEHGKLPAVYFEIVSHYLLYALYKV